MALMDMAIRCLFGKTRETAPICPPMWGCDAACPQAPASARCLGWSSTYAEAADTSEPPNANPIPHHRSGFNRRAAYEFPVSCRHSRTPIIRHGRPAKDEADLSSLRGRMKLARQLPWLDHKLPAILLFQCIDCGHVDMVEWPASDEEAPSINFCDSLGAHHTCGYRLANGSGHPVDPTLSGKQVDYLDRPIVKDSGRIDAANRERAGTLTPRLQSRSPSVAPLMPRHRYDAPTIWLIVRINP